mgnify:CR=1 FL=1
MKKIKIIAEIGPNHNGSIKNAKKLVKKLANFEIDYIKFQFSNPNDVYSKDSFKADYQKKNDGKRSIINMSKSHQLTLNEHIQLNKLCNKLNKKYACSAFDLESLKKLNSNISLPFFKIPSGEICSIDMLKYISKSNKKILLSTGMAEISLIEYVLKILKNKNKDKDIVLMHCVSSYPTKEEHINLNFMKTLNKKFKIKLGFSDHTKGYLAAIGAVSLGAEYIEKHVTLSNSLKGPDQKTSMNLTDFKNYVNQIRKFEKILGKNFKKINADELNVKKVSRKSIVINKNLKKGEKIKLKDISFKRPGTGFNPLYYKFIINKKLKKDVYKNKMLRVKDIQLSKKILEKFLN